MSRQKVAGRCVPIAYHYAQERMLTPLQEYVSQLRAFAKEVEEQQLEAKEHTGAIMAARQADELIEAIPFVAHLSNQIMKRVADFGSPKLADEQKAEMALDGLALGDQLSKEAMPKLVKESILVALGTDSVDARNRMLMAAKKIAAVRSSGLVRPL